MTKPKATIPLCRSEFLQDVSIELGRRLKALRYRERDLEFRVGEDKNSGNKMFSVTSWDGAGEYTQVLVWDDKIALYVHRPWHPKHTKARYTRYYADVSDHDATEIALLIRDSLYGTEDETRNFWKLRNAKLNKS